MSFINNESVITVEKVSKKFCKTIKHVMLYGASDIAKDFIGMRSKTEKLRNGEFWALDDVSFELRKGETLGIIGVNGSGKSTMLRLLNGIFMPDKGKIEVTGRVGALIAVGAGFHPLLTGRENVYVNGQILGMSKKEIDAKFKQIVEFAEIGDFIDAPVKHYSSGMFVRLGFSVAIHCDPTILLVDEVLAVGDAAFKKKCMTKIQELKKATSTIFISHNMYQVQRICDRAIFLHNGKILFEGQPEVVINQYYNYTINQDFDKTDNSLIILDSTGDIEDLKMQVLNSNGEETNFFKLGEEVHVEFTFFCKSEIDNPNIGLVLSTVDGNVLGSTKNIHLKTNPINKLTKGKNHIKCIIRRNMLTPGLYRFAFKWKIGDNTMLLQATGGKVVIESQQDKLYYEGSVVIDGDWKKLQ
ncbi:MAG: ABC transporter ATP-binding protein [Spirochaetes bacterium]|nr:ABC transporter ATP-binding protein [Spirochaetota bacterium]